MGIGCFGKVGGVVCEGMWVVGGGCRVFVGNGGLVGCEGGIGYSDKKNNRYVVHVAEVSISVP